MRGRIVKDAPEVCVFRNYDYLLAAGRCTGLVSDVNDEISMGKKRIT